MTCLTKIEILADQILQKLPGLSAWRYRFMLHLFSLWPALRGRYNFMNLGRQGRYGEYTYRKHFARSFDWLAFNTHLADQTLGPQRIIALDPSYLRKSGKHTAGLDYFYSGTAAKSLWGLEITGLAVVDLESKTALHLEAVQTVARKADESLLAYYANLLVQRANQLQTVSKLVVADAYFSRTPFISKVLENGFHLISRLRKDTVLRYYFRGQQKPRGRPRKYAGRVDVTYPDPAVFSLVEGVSNAKVRVYEGVVELKAALLPIKAVIVQQLDDHDKIKSTKMYMSTDGKLSAGEIMHAYGCRYQQEFIFRDGKQFSGLEQCQAREGTKIAFHVNTALTVVNLAKVAHHLSMPADQRGAFSMADICNAYANERLALRIFSRCSIDPNQPKIRAILDEIRIYAARAA